MRNADESIETITVVGGGDSGLLTALLLKQLNSSVNVRVIDDLESDGISVGKGTFANIYDILHETLEITPQRFVRAVKPVWKASVYFEDWCGADPFHVTFDKQQSLNRTVTEKTVQEAYHRYQSGAEIGNSIARELVNQQKTPILHIDDRDSWEIYSSVAYHLTISRFNSFLKTLCRERDIALIDDRVTDVQSSGNQIRRVSSETQSYESDLYVDATGFTRLLIGELDTTFSSFDIPLDSAVTTTTDINIDKIVPATVVNSGDAGWFWQIDTVDDRDYGYVYSSDHISDEDALDEFTAQHSIAVDRGDVTQYSFTSGRFEDAWVNNCVAVGNAFGFVEPLQALGLSVTAGLSTELAEIIAESLQTNTESGRQAYNELVQREWDGAYDFIAAHYLAADGDTEFWRDIQEIRESPRLQNHVTNYKHAGALSAKRCQEESKGPSTAWLHFVVFHGAGVDIPLYDDKDIEIDQRIRDKVSEHDAELRELGSDHLSYEEVVEAGVYGDLSET